MITAEGERMRALDALAARQRLLAASGSAGRLGLLSRRHQVSLAAALAAGGSDASAVRYALETAQEAVAEAARR